MNFSHIKIKMHIQRRTCSLFRTSRQITHKSLNQCHIKISGLIYVNLSQTNINCIPYYGTEIDLNMFRHFMSYYHYEQITHSLNAC